MTPYRRFDLPQPLRPLLPLLGNLSWTWSPRARALVERIDADAWQRSRGRIDAFLDRVPDGRWAHLAGDGGFVDELTAVCAEQSAYLASTDTWWRTHHGEELPGGIAYFSAEFGLHEGLPIYSGGLGVLAGDHLKSASDLNLPLVAVGLFYQEGYFRQHVEEGGRQAESYEPLPPERAGLRRAIGAGGQPLEVYAPLYDRNVRCEVWRVDVGRVPLLLLDTDVAGNSEEDRWLTRRLYGGDPRTRICQEVVLGIGGLRALRGFGRRPDVLHLNEGHTAFALLERLREELAHGHSRDAAWDLVRRSAVFTTHTPVAAGHDRFWYELVDQVLGPWALQLGLYTAELMDLGRVHSGGDEQLCMTVLALKGTRSANGVSEKHGEVSRDMWKELWPERQSTSVPIGHITNGVHAPTWLGPDIQELLDRRCGLAWRSALPEGGRFAAAESLPKTELWAAHNRQKERLTRFIAARTGCAVDPNALLIGFARRFATYKRGALVLSDRDRALRLLTSRDRPAWLIYAGKAHPRDEHGKAVIQKVLQAASDPAFQGRVVFLQDYDMAVGRALVQGVDLWVNNPRRPLEASGTSGQKVAMNGGLNCSTLDGWWLEGIHKEPLAGWGVGRPEPAADDSVGDREDAGAMYSTLENEVMPAFYNRDADGLPQMWLDRMAAAIASCLPAFNTDRMVADYARKAYLAG